MLVSGDGDGGVASSTNGRGGLWGRLTEAVAGPVACTGVAALTFAGVNTIAAAAAAVAREGGGDDGSAGGC